MGCSSIRHRSARSRKARAPTAIASSTKPQRHAPRAAIRSAHFTPRNETYSSAAATASDSRYFNQGVRGRASIGYFSTSSTGQWSDPKISLWMSADAIRPFRASLTRK